MWIFFAIILTIGLCHCFQNIYSQVEIWGVTAEGGKFNQGCIYRTDENGDNQEILHSFSGPTGVYPQGGHPIELENGKIYGLLTGSTGRDEPILIIYEFDLARELYSIVYRHDNPQLGYEPYGGLIKGKNGRLYGTTTKGGKFNQGVLFEYHVQDRQLSILHDFERSSGCEAFGRLCYGNDGLLYGMTHSGGSNNEGVIFKIDPEIKSFLKLFDFDAKETGAYPQGNLIQATDGSLYGMTRLGGLYEKGILFAFEPISGTFEILLHFDGNNLGSSPKGGLVEVGTLSFYGLTCLGGSYNKGTLFVFNMMSREHHVLHHFNTVDGAYPNGNLTYGSGNVLSGTTFKGGVMGYGTLFEWDLNDQKFSKKADFEGMKNGKYPLGDLLITSAGRYFGYSSEGGRNDMGVLFEYSPTGEILDHIDFNEKHYGTHPVKILIMDNGYMYGINQHGGLYNQGTLFHFIPTSNSLQKLWDFKSENPDLIPVDLICASDGNLYGLLSSTFNPQGSILYQFSIDDKSCQIIEDYFSPYRDADPNMDDPGSLFYDIAGPLYSLIEVPDQIIMVNEPGAGMGDLYQESRFYFFDLFTKEQLSNKYFSGGNQYGNPLFLPGKDYFIAMNYDGWQHEMGYISLIYPFNLDWPHHTTQVIVKLNGKETGAYPKGTLIQAANQNIYGFTTMGGENDKGIIFEMSVLNSNYSFRKLFDFDYETTGCHPEGRLLESSNGKLYGTTETGGSYGFGVFFEMDPRTGVFEKKFDFQGRNGKSPVRSNLIMKRKILITDLSPGLDTNSFGIKVFPNPVRDWVYLEINESIKKAYLTIYDLKGKEIIATSVSNKNLIRIESGILHTGMHVAVLTTENGTYNSKFIVE